VGCFLVIANFMRLVIEQKGCTYKIYRNNVLAYSGHWFSSWRKGLQTELFDIKGNLCLTIKIDNKRFMQWDWNTIYTLNLIDDNKNYKLKCIKYRQQYWQLNSDKDIYDYYNHLGHLKSIFKNNFQIAKVDKEKFHLLDQNSIFIDFDEGENELILLGLVLKFEMGNDNGEAAFTFDFGNIAGQAKIFDNEWRPK
jgi:hypothetical protein